MTPSMENRKLTPEIIMYAICFILSVFLMAGEVFFFAIAKPPSLWHYPLKFQVQQVFPTTPLTIATNHSSTDITFGFNASLWIGNPCAGFVYQSNAKVDIYYRHPDYPKVSDYYLTSSSPLKDFGVPDTTCSLVHGDYIQSQMSVIIAASSLQVSDESTSLSMHQDLKKGEMTLIFEIVADYRMRLMTSQAKLKVKCDGVKIMVPSGFVVGESKKSCKVDWDCNKWFHFCDN